MRAIWCGVLANILNSSNIIGICYLPVKPILSAHAVFILHSLIQSIKWKGGANEKSEYNKKNIYIQENGIYEISWKVRKEKGNAQIK